MVGLDRSPSPCWLCSHWLRHQPSFTSPACFSHSQGGIECYMKGWMSLLVGHNDPNLFNKFKIFPKFILWWKIRPSLFKILQLNLFSILKSVFSCPLKVTICFELLFTRKYSTKLFCFFSAQSSFNYSWWDGQTYTTTTVYYWLKIYVAVIKSVLYQSRLDGKYICMKVCPLLLKLRFGSFHTNWNISDWKFGLSYLEEHISQ